MQVVRILSLTLALSTSVAVAQPATQPAAPASPAVEPGAPAPLDVLKGRPDAATLAERLGEPFVSEAAGISLHAPAGMTQVRRAGGTEQVAQFVDRDREWVFRIDRTLLKDPVALSSVTSTELRPPAGFLELRSEALRNNQPGAEIVRQDVIELPDATRGGVDAGLLFARHGGGGLKRVLSQQAFVQANDQLYYTLTLVTPAAKLGPDGVTPEDDAGELQAVAAFDAVLNTVRLLDRSGIREDQNQRLFRTRALFVNLSDRARLEQALVPEQWLRVMRDGKDVGYSYVVEEVQTQGPNEGISVGVRSRTIVTPDDAGSAATPAGATPAAPTAAPDAAPTASTQPAKPVQLDAESLLWVSFDRRHETWSTAIVRDDGSAEPDHTTEFGVSDREVSRVLDEAAPLGDKFDPRNPAVRQSETYTLNVTTVSRRTNAEPIDRDLPPFYLPQALGHLLPRLVPLREPKTYLFASYVPEVREVMQRYVDVGREREVELGGQRVRAIPVQDRIGLEGSITTHWVAPDGKYLGSSNPDSGITVLSTDKATIERLWAGANLTRPEQPGNAPTTRRSPRPADPQAPQPR